MFCDTATEDFFRARLDHMLDLRQPLPVLASRMPWQQIEASVAHVFSRKARNHIAMPDLDLFGETIAPVASKSNAGRPRVPLRIMIALLYLKHAFNESDEGVVARWAETPSWQFFSGRAYFEQRQPCDATTLVKFRQLLGEDGAEALLAQTINIAVGLDLIKPEQLQRVIVDSTVQHKAIAHPTDSRLLETARAKLVEAAKDAGVALKQTFAKEGTELGRKAGRYAHARQFRRMRRTIKRQRTIVARLQREIARKATHITGQFKAALDQAQAKASRIVLQSTSKKALQGQPKLYSWHAPEVSCINKGKSRQPYEFGVKVGIASTLEHNLVVGAKAFHGNPFDGHTLNEQISQAAKLMKATQARPRSVYVDLGYRGVDKANAGVGIWHRGKFKQMTPYEKTMLKRRQAIEPIIGHLKQDCRMGRCHLKGELGDKLHAVLCAAGYNIRWLLRAIAQQGLGFLWSLLLRLNWVTSTASRMMSGVLERVSGGFNALIRQVGQNQFALLGRI